MVKNLRNGIVSLIVTFVAVWCDVTGSGHYQGLCNTIIYGIHPVFSFDHDNATWQTLDWDKVQDTPMLIALRAQQIARCDKVTTKAHRQACLTCYAIEDFNHKFKNQLSFTDFKVGMWVLWHETWLEGQKGNKDAWRWSGPFIIHEKHPNDSYVLRELDRTVIQGHVTMHQLKLFYFRADQHLLHSISSLHFNFIFSFPHKKNKELRNFYAWYVHHNFKISLSQNINHLLPIVTYLPGAIHYPTNHDLKAPDLWSGYPTVLNLCDKINVALGTKMARIEAHVMFTSYLASTASSRSWCLTQLSATASTTTRWKNMSIPVPIALASIAKFSIHITFLVSSFPFPFVCLSFLLFQLSLMLGSKSTSLALWKR